MMTFRELMWDLFGPSDEAVREWREAMESMRGSIVRFGRRLRRLWPSGDCAICGCPVERGTAVWSRHLCAWVDSVCIPAYIRRYGWGAEFAWLDRGEEVRASPPPEPLVGVGTSGPSWMPPDAMAEWQRVYPKLNKDGPLTMVDRSTLVSYCLAWVEVKQLTEFLAKQKRLVVRTTCGLKPFPEVGLRTAAINTMLKCASELGFRPTDIPPLKSNLYSLDERKGGP